MKYSIHKYRAFLIQNQNETPRLFTYVFSFLSVVFFLILRRMRRKARRYWKANEKRPACSRPYRLRGICTCIATGDSPRSSIINVHWVSQVEAPKSIYPTAFCPRVKCIMRSAIVCARSRTLVHIRLSNMSSNALKLPSDEILQVLKLTRHWETKIDLFSRVSPGGWLMRWKREGDGEERTEKRLTGKNQFVVGIECRTLSLFVMYIYAMSRHVCTSTIFHRLSLYLLLRKMR